MCVFNRLYSDIKKKIHPEDDKILRFKFGFTCLGGTKSVRQICCNLFQSYFIWLTLNTVHFHSFAPRKSINLSLSNTANLNVA